MEQAKLIDIYEHLFAEPGWKELIEDLNQKRESIKDAMAEGNWNFDQVQFYRGLIAGYKYVCSLEGMIETAKNQSLPEPGGMPDIPG